MNFIPFAKEVLRTEADTLLEATALFDASWNDIVELIHNLKGKLVIMGVGKSGLVASKMAATFASTGTPSFFIHPTEAMHGDLGMVTKDDCVIAISNSGESSELTALLPHIKRFDVPLIGMSAKKTSTLGNISDYFINIAINKEACPLGIAPMSSTTLTMAMGDALAVCLMQKKGFEKEDFASFHPGGSLGKRLFVKALEIARTNNLPIINENASLKEAIEVMNQGKLGTVLLQKEDKITALLSDGDLRRALMSKDFDINESALLYANKTPKRIQDSNLLASDALALIEAKKIQVLIIENEQQQLIGLLHIHDLIEAGIDNG
jgi:arabinose-5-phosphate isomerase